MRRVGMRKRALPAALVVVALLTGIMPGCSCGGQKKAGEERGARAASRRRTKIENVHTYANTYQDYTPEDLEKLKRFDIVAIEPYFVPDREFLKELKAAGTRVIAYVSVGEADEERRYWKGWEPGERTPDNHEIPRTEVTKHDPMFIGEDPGWLGSYYVDASNPGWRNVMLNEEIPYILWLAGGQYDGLVMDLVDVVDKYEGRTNERRMRQGMIDLIKAIRDKYPDLLLVPNRGFGILEEMAPYIDAFKFEEMTGAYGNVKGEPHYGQYYLKIGDTGKLESQEEVDQLLEVLEEHPMPVLVLDHVSTDPPDEQSAKRCFDVAARLSAESGEKFVWYGNSVDQDLPVWSFLTLKDTGKRTDGAVLLYAPKPPASVQNPAFSPDGQTIVFTMFHKGYNKGPAGLYRMPSGGGTPAKILDERGQDSVNVPGTCWNAALNRITFASDRKNTDEIWTVSPDGSELSSVTMHSMLSYYIEPSFSPDGKWIVFESDIEVSEEERQGSIMKVKTDGSEVKCLTDGMGGGTDDRLPNWSPMGDRILFQRRKPGSDDWNLYTMAPDGSDIRQVTEVPSSDTDASWSSDGKWIVYSSDHGGIPIPNIFIIPSGGGTPTRVTRNDSNEEGAASWSPDCRWIVFESHPGPEEDTPASLWRIPVPELK